MNTLTCIKTTNNGGANYIQDKEYEVTNESDYVYEVKSEEGWVILYSKFETSPYYYGNIFSTT